MSIDLLLWLLLPASAAVCRAGTLRVAAGGFFLHWGAGVLGDAAVAGGVAFGLLDSGAAGCPLAWSERIAGFLVLFLLWLTSSCGDD